jgi:hypothetical protein
MYPAKKDILLSVIVFENWGTFAPRLTILLFV